MPLTRNFRETVMARVKSDPVFRGELIVEATNAFLLADMETGKALLRDYLNATESIADIARELQVFHRNPFPPHSLIVPIQSTGPTAVR